MASKTFRFDETKYYKFGLMLGIKNVLHAGFRLGLKKTAGKLLQPVNSYTRFPEYWFMGSEAEQYLRQFPSSRRPKVLDVGSPKLFGLYLAFHFDIEIYLTDIDAPSITEAEVLWGAIRDRAKGKAYFSIEDARSLKYPEENFDMVYAMSVIEHVDGQAGDAEAMREMVRVLKPGGLLLVTVPFGHEYAEQERVGLQGAARQTSSQERFFFQRIYTPAAAEERIVGVVPGATLAKAVSVRRKDSTIARVYRRMGADLRGLCGCFNPILSVALNASQDGIVPVPGNYGALHGPNDVYGDLMLAWNKTPS
jgi:SAM-dependent methyltransferase